LRAVARVRHGGAVLRSRFRALIFLVMAGALLTPARAQEDVEPLDLANFYSHRFRFNAVGSPVVTVGLMTGQTEVAVRSIQAQRMRYRDKEGEKTLQLPAGRRVVVKLRDAAAAKIRRWVVVDTLERDDRVRRDDVRERWEREALGETRVFEVGGIYGVEGTVVDNRASLIAVAPRLDTEVDALILRVYQKLRVRARTHEELVEPPRGTLVVQDEAGTPLAVASGVVEITAPAGSITVEKIEHGVGYKSHGYEDRVYADRLLVAIDSKGKLAAINELEVDALLKGIVPSEIFPNAPAEALKAQAVTARGEVFAKIGLRHLTDPFVLCDDQHCQVYSGVSAEKPGCSAAVDATRGEMAFLGGRLVDSVYSAMCGGRSEDNEVVWEVPPSAALRGRVDAEGAAALLAVQAAAEEHAGHTHTPPPLTPDPTRAVAHPGLLAAMDLSSDAALRTFLDDPPPAFCARASLGKKDKFRWTRRFTRDELNEKTRDLAVGDVFEIAVEGRGKSGRVRTLRVTGNKSTAFVHRELPVRRLFGMLPSGLFVVDEERSVEGHLAAVTFKGGGFGHGVGMCQTGAVGMAEAGLDYRAILRHYYNGAEVRRVY